MARHDRLYFQDGSLTLKAGDGSETLYNVYQGTLMMSSEFFRGMLTLPIPALAPLSLTDNAKDHLTKARDQGLEGTSDETAVVFPAQFKAAEIESFLVFMFLQGWSEEVPDVETARAVLKISHFFGVDTGINFARRHLNDRQELAAVDRLEMGFDYHIKEWIAKAFDELMGIPINDLSEEEELTMGWRAYRALAKAQAEVLDYRLTLASKPPTPNHCNWCTNHTYCEQEWEKMWTGMSGVLGALVKEELAGSEILDKLITYPVGGMNRECHRRTCEGLHDTAETISVLKREEQLIDRAVARLIEQQGIS
ncbi:hypothetical protein C8R44DRAFT_894237 [Mycena epipterygia]|nr:hypothetical protein C8R44DRAFT_894237 [Mycena epipterygia]